MMEAGKTESKFFVRIRTGSIEALIDLQKVWDLDVFRHTARDLASGTFEIQGLLTDSEISKMLTQGYVVEKISNADEVASQRMKELKRRENE